MRKLRCLVALVTIVAALVGLTSRPPSPALALGNALTRVNPSLQVVPTGTFGIDINVSNISNLYGADFQLTFDPNLVSVVDVAPAPGVQVALGPLLTSGSGGYFSIINSADNTAGSVRVALTQLSPSVPVSSPGVLAHITFQALKFGAVVFHLSNVQFADRNGFAIPTDTADGSAHIGVATAVTVSSFSVMPSETALSTPWIAGLQMLSLVIIVTFLCALRLRRRT